MEANVDEGAAAEGEEECEEADEEWTVERSDVELLEDGPVCSPAVDCADELLAPLLDMSVEEEANEEEEEEESEEEPKPAEDEVDTEAEDANEPLARGVAGEAELLEGEEDNTDELDGALPLLSPRVLPVLPPLVLLPLLVRVT